MRIMQNVSRVVIVLLLLSFVNTMAWAQPVGVAMPNKSVQAQTGPVLAVKSLNVSMPVRQAATATEAITGTATAETPTETPTVETATETPQATESATVTSTETVEAPTLAATETATVTDTATVAAPTPLATETATTEAPTPLATETLAATATPGTLPVTGASSSGNPLMWLVGGLAFLFVVGSERILRRTFRRD